MEISKDGKMRKIHTIQYGQIEVTYAMDLNGGGVGFGQDYIPLVKKMFGKVGRVCEFCSGPGFIGFSLLANKLCDSLCLVDVNPDAIELCRQTIRENKLERVASAYVSDGLRSVPKSEQWDLVVGNPPHFDGDQEAYRSNILLIDPNWSIHKEFYNGVGKHLSPAGSILLMENGDGSGAETWRSMIPEGGLHHADTFSYKPTSVYLQHRNAYYSKQEAAGKAISPTIKLGKSILTPFLYAKWRMSYPYYFVWSKKV